MEIHSERDVSNAEGEPTNERLGEEPATQLENADAMSDTEVQLSPEQQIVNTIDELNYVDHEIALARTTVAETESRLATLRASIGTTRIGEESPAIGFQQDKLKALEEQKHALIEQKNGWIRKNGRESLPSGVAVEDEEGVLIAKGVSRDNEQDPDSSNEASEEKEKELELRQQWLKKMEKEAVEHFERAIRADWRTKDAGNINIAVELMRLRVPKAMNKEAEEFIKGKSDQPPFSAVWIRWDTSSSIDRLLNRPNWIRSLDIMFDDKAKTILDSADLKKGEFKETTEVASSETGQM